VRRRGRADEAGLAEEDVLLAVNGKTCQGLSCGQAMDLVESSGLNVILRVSRSVGLSVCPLCSLLSASGLEIQSCPKNCLRPDSKCRIFCIRGNGADILENSTMADLLVVILLRDRK